MQAKNINIGVGVQDVEYISKKMAMEVFSAYSRDAFQLMSERVEVFAQTYISHLLKESPDSIENIKDPGVQAAILEAESAYAKTGDDDLGSLLVDILTQRTSAMNRDVVQLALSESIEVAQKLTSRQYSSLSLIFLLRHVKFGARTIGELRERFRDNLAPVAAEAVVSSTDAQHLVATGCAILQPLRTDLPKFILNTYPGFFNMGLTEDDATVRQLPDAYFMRCVRDQEKIQVAAPDAEVLERVMRDKRASDDERQMLANLLTANLMQPDEVMGEITEIAPGLALAHEKWEKSMFGQLSLTSVGIVLAHSNVLRVTEGKFDAPLRTFLPES
ncbi:LPO_1073/Vpar_1526 family protein [Streptomyces antibioticus]|uniref:LPO_1073/Vpar_1526 family protein n=1 Tax=Streptomyces antibioticus TaxID=1890 RepID=UPI003F46AE1B